MAFNNWDKLSKAQRDYPKPKFAVAVVDKALKKNLKNPFLCAWRADLSLRLNQDPELVLSGLQQTCQLPGLTDTRLLSYLYKLCAETSRRPSGAFNISSIGTEFLKPWQNAAKALGRKHDRLELWDALFNAAMREDCWEDVRFAVVNYNKEGSPSKKLAHYTHILTVQLAAEQKHKQLNKDAQMALIQFAIARKLMTQAYEASPDDPIVVKDIRDLRFMAEIFRRQDRCAELFSLWDDPPSSLKKLMRTHRDDLISLKTRLLRQQNDWLLLENHCYDSIEEVISQLNLVQDSKSLWELCAWRWDLWNGLLQATRAIRHGQQGRDKISDVMDRCFGAGFHAKDRPLRLTYMHLRCFVNTPMLSDCKEYWEHHFELSSCFADLRQFVQRLPLEDQKDFSRFITNRTKEIHARLGKDEVAFGHWQQAEQNVLKFDYLLTVSLPKSPIYDALENFITKAIRFCVVCPRSPDGGFLAIYALLNLHHRIVRYEDRKVPFEATANTRVLLQATMLARHLVARDENKQNRALALLATRLHLNLGLGKIAYQLYSHTKCKEMLLDTLSPYVLSRISLTHPFKIGGYQGFSADDELAKVIGTIERMEQKTDSYLFTDMQSFVWDQAVDALHLKRKLNSSLTKHICITERRRIARLRGESTENLPSLNYKAHNEISDNVDRSVFPNFESTASIGPLPLVMPNGIPDKLWLAEAHWEWETVSRVLNREGTFTDPEPWKTKNQVYAVGPEWANRTSAEVHLKSLWNYIRKFTWELLHNGDSKRLYEDDGKELMDDVRLIRKAMEKLRMPGSTGLNPEDEPTMFHENMLISCYTKLEALRVLNKLVDHLREKVFNAKSTHAMKSKMPKNWVNDLASETQICYEAIRDVAQSYIHLIRTRGVAAIKAQIRWGKTGNLLEAVLKDDDVDYYASEYVESALEAWNGVMKVKLK
ncbi:Nn.00g098920.m01.CDS01 [Neocucurbitaria sp. VM-36]